MRSNAHSISPTWGGGLVVAPKLTCLYRMFGMSTYESSRGGGGGWGEEGGGGEVGERRLTNLCHPEYVFIHVRRDNLMSHNPMSLRLAYCRVLRIIHLGGYSRNGVGVR